MHGGFSDAGDIVGALYCVTITAKDADDDYVPGGFSIQDCCKDDWTYNAIQNPASVKDEEWSGSRAAVAARRHTVVQSKRPRISGA
jgi:hypothetical protein